MYCMCVFAYRKCFTFLTEPGSEQKIMWMRKKPEQI